MKIRFTQVLIGDCIRYTVQMKQRWWNRWQYLYDGQLPRLFTKEELELWFLGKKLNNGN